MQPLRKFQILTEIVENIDRTRIDPGDLTSIIQNIQQALTPENVKKETGSFILVLKGYPICFPYKRRDGVQMTYE